jgi:hypothetical protein
MLPMRFAGRQSTLFGLLCVLFLLAICLAVALPRFCRGINYSDEGFLAYSAIRICEGQIPNRDSSACSLRFHFISWRVCSNCVGHRFSAFEFSAYSCTSPFACSPILSPIR